MGEGVGRVDSGLGEVSGTGGSEVGGEGVEEWEKEEDCGGGFGGWGDAAAAIANAGAGAAG